VTIAIRPSSGSIVDNIHNNVRYLDFWYPVSILSRMMYGRA
jgi:hypothetical protein